MALHLSKDEARRLLRRSHDPDTRMLGIVDEVVYDRKRARQTQPETKLRKACLDYLAIKGIFAVEYKVGATKIGNRFIRFGEPGFPDIFGNAIWDDAWKFDGRVGRPRFFGLELKHGRGRQSPEQKAMQKRIERSGGLYFVIRSLDELANLFP